MEREERMAQVNKALQDMHNRRAGDMIRSTKNIFQSAKDNAQSTTAPRTEFHTVPSWFSPLEKTNDDVVNAGREYASDIVDNKFNQGWPYALGKENIYDYSSPIYNSRYKDVLIDSVTDNAKADFVAGLGATGKFAVDSIMDIDEASSVIDGTKVFFNLANPVLKNSLLKGVATIGSKAAPLIGVAYNISKGGLSEVVNTYENLKSNNARAAQSQRQYEHLSNSELKYLVDDEKAREKFINTLLSEVSNIQNAEQFGYLPPEINQKYKEEAIRAIMRIVYLNQNYDKYAVERNAILRNK